MVMMHAGMIMVSMMMHDDAWWCLMVMTSLMLMMNMMLAQGDVDDYDGGNEDAWLCRLCMMKYDDA